MVCRRLGLGERRARVLQVEEDLVGREALGLLQEAGVAARHRETGAARTQTVDGRGHAGTSRGSSLFALRISSTMRPMIPVMSKSFGVKTAATPAARSCSASPFGMMPPAITGMSVGTGHTQPFQHVRHQLGVRSGQDRQADAVHVLGDAPRPRSARASAGCPGRPPRSRRHGPARRSARRRWSARPGPACPPGSAACRRPGPWRSASTLRRTSASGRALLGGDRHRRATRRPVGARNSPNTSRRAPAHSPVVTPARAHSRVASMRLPVPLRGLLQPLQRLARARVVEGRLVARVAPVLQRGDRHGPRPPGRPSDRACPGRRSAGWARSSRRC